MRDPRPFVLAFARFLVFRRFLFSPQAKLLQGIEADCLNLASLKALSKNLNGCTRRGASFDFSSMSQQRSSVLAHGRASLLRHADQGREGSSTWPQIPNLALVGKGGWESGGEERAILGCEQEVGACAGDFALGRTLSRAQQSAERCRTLQPPRKKSPFSRLSTSAFLPAQNKTLLRLLFNKRYQARNTPEPGGARVSLPRSLQAAPLCICIMKPSLMT